jgi:hypothetical protein
LDPEVLPHTTARLPLSQRAVMEAKKSARRTSKPRARTDFTPAHFRFATIRHVSDAQAVDGRGFVAMIRFSLLEAGQSRLLCRIGGSGREFPARPLRCIPQNYPLLRFGATLTVRKRHPAVID